MTGIAMVRVMKRTEAALMPLKGSRRKASQRAMNAGFNRGFFIMDVRAFIPSYLFFLTPAEQTFRFYQQYYDEDDERVGVLIFARDVPRSKALDESEQ